MPTLTRKIIEIQLPTSTSEDPAWVKVYNRMTVGDYDNWDSEKKQDSLYELYAKLITEWNFQDENGNVYPITAENIKLLDPKDFTAIREAVTGNKELDTAKKNS